MKQERAPMRCSFCHKSESQIRKLISSPSDYPRAYICDECVRVCASILQDNLGVIEEERKPQPPAPAAPEPSPESLLGHPMASELLTFAELWIKQESSGRDASAELNQLRAAARLMFVNPDV